MAKNIVPHAHAGEQFTQFLSVADQLFFVAMMLRRIASSTNKSGKGVIFFPGKTSIQNALALKHIATLLHEQNILSHFCVMANAFSYELPIARPEPQTGFVFSGGAL